MENLKNEKMELIKEWKENYKKLESVTKEHKEAKERIDNAESKQMANFRKLESHEQTPDEYNTKMQELKKEKEKAAEALEVATVKEKLLCDNEDIINKKIAILIINNIINKYNQIGEKTAKKIDDEIKDYLKDIYNEKYISLVNDAYGYNQFLYIHNVDEWEKDYCTKEASLCLYSNRNHGQDRGFTFYLLNGVIKLNKYSKTLEEIKQDNENEQKKIEEAKTIENATQKAKSIIKAYNKKKEKIENLKKEIEQQDRNFRNEITQDNGSYLHNIYYYFYR